MNIPIVQITKDMLAFIDRNKIDKYTEIAHLINIKATAHGRNGLIYVDTAKDYANKISAYLIIHTMSEINPPLELHMNIGAPSTRITVICNEKLKNYVFFGAVYEGTVVQWKTIDSVDMPVIKSELEQIITHFETKPKTKK
ncbi:Uncharacterised protein [Candidatus Tiddalikarchaeum anstoanum]|nr:Uncharacterised protein [Candidatus Tiddalikarchaeum anstoanum]